jgi:flagellar assembly protein FliH
MRKTNLFTESRPKAKPNAAETPSLRKFLFEHSFDNAAGAARAPERKPVTLKPEQYDALKKESYDLGFAAGQKTGFDEQAERLAATLAEVGQTIEAMIGNMQALQKQSEQGMRRMALAIARKLLPDFTARNGIQEIEAMLNHVMDEMAHEPRLVVRVHESQFDAISNKIGELSAQKAYTGKVVVLADAEIAAGDCRIEWADGGMERNTQATWGEIEKVVAPQDGANPNQTQE